MWAIAFIQYSHSVLSYCIWSTHYRVIKITYEQALIGQIVALLSESESLDLRMHILDTREEAERRENKKSREWWLFTTRLVAVLYYYWMCRATSLTSPYFTVLEQDRGGVNWMTSRNTKIVTCSDMSCCITFGKKKHDSSQPAAT